jgi:hypothetical protein
MLTHDPETRLLPVRAHDARAEAGAPRLATPRKAARWAAPATALLAAVAAALTLIGYALAAAPHALEGTYRVSWTEDQLRAAGTSRRNAAAHHGVTTLRLHAGRYSLSTVSHDRPGGVACTGGYNASATRITIELGGPYCEGLLEATWTRTGRRLRFHVLATTDHAYEVLVGAKRWRRVDDRSGTHPCAGRSVADRYLLASRLPPPPGARTPCVHRT